jgi:hypothetical protein
MSVPIRRRVLHIGPPQSLNSTGSTLADPAVSPLASPSSEPAADPLPIKDNGVKLAFGAEHVESLYFSDSPTGSPQAVAHGKGAWTGPFP